MAGWPSPASPRDLSLEPLEGTHAPLGRGGHRADPDENGLSKTRPQPEQHQAFKQKPPELAFRISLSSLLSGNRSHTRPDFALCTPKGANPQGPPDEPRLSQMWNRSPGLINDLSQLT